MTEISVVKYYLTTEKTDKNKMTLYYYLPVGTDPEPIIVRTRPIIGWKPYKVVEFDKDGNVTTIATRERLVRK